MHTSGNLLYERLKRHSHLFHKVIPFDPKKDKLFHFDFTKDNKELDKLKNELTDIKADLKKNMEIAAVMTRYRLSFDEKKAIAGGVISELTGRKL